MEDVLQEGSLGCCLELQPLFCEILLLQSREGDQLRCVVLLEEIVHDGAGLGAGLAGLFGCGCEAFTSASRRSVLGSSITGDMPLRFRARKAGCFSSGVVRIWVV